MSTIKTTNIQHPSAASPAVELTAAGGLWLGGGKILQVVRATDSTNRTTTSNSFVDANISVTITPQKSDSVILVLSSLIIELGTGNSRARFRIADASDNAISGAENSLVGANSSLTNRLSVFLIAYDTPATTTAKTYKLRFLSNDGVSVTINNTNQTGQMYAIEVSA